jgi:hypothetical protein
MKRNDMWAGFLDLIRIIFVTEAGFYVYYSLVMAG